MLRNNQLNLWVAKDSIYPFVIKSAIYSQAVCIAILPLINSPNINNIEIKNLYYKMLEVLNLPKEKLAIIYCYKNYDNISISNILRYYNRVKLLLQFDDLDYFEADFLEKNNINFIKTLHPEYLLNHPAGKKKVYKDLLLCKSLISKKN